ncbi:MAG: sulfatase [Thermoprotei archaeon]|nr:sulfatase [Thermoprotei archaeon]
MRIEKIIIIISDTFRRDFLGCYGNKWIHTPNLDRFAKRSIVFDKAYTGSFPTIPHRSDLFTGRYCFHNRGWAPLPPEEDTFPKILRKAGYFTKMIADTPHIRPKEMNFTSSFDECEFPGDWESFRYEQLPPPKPSVKPPCAKSKLRFPDRAYIIYPRLVALKEKGEEHYFCARTIRKAMEWLKEGCKHEKFLLYVDIFEPHEPWLPPDEYVDLYDPGYEGELVFWPRYDYSNYLTKEELKHMRALYAGMVTLVDKWVGLLLDEIEELGLLDEAAVIFTSDHGFYHGEHGRVGKHTVLDPKDGWPLYEEICHIPLIMSIPDAPRGVRCNALVQPVDVMATILDLAGVQILKHIHGSSLLPVIFGEKERVREIAVSCCGGPCFQLFREGKLPPPPPHVKPFVLSSDPEYVTYSTITDGRWSLIYARKGLPAELYDLQADPKQERNVILNELDIAKRLHGRFYKFLSDIGTCGRSLELREEL